jgi:Alkylmercury lyase
VHQFHAPYGQFGRTAQKPFELTSDAKKLRRFLEDSFLEHETGSSLAEIIEGLKFSQDQACEALYELERGIQVMFVPGTENLMKMPPFSCGPTRHRVSASKGRRWYAGCTLEAAAFSGLLPGQDVLVSSICPDCWTRSP